MKKEEFIKKYGEAAYEKMSQQNRDWRAQHSEKINARAKEWRANNPDKVKANNHEEHRKGGKYYEQKLKYQTIGIPGKRQLVRTKHAYRYRPYKSIIAPDSQIHHEWISGTPNFRGVALVEKDRHMHGYIDVIQILEGEITLLTEAEIREK